MLTARSECHVPREAAVIRGGNGTLHGGACIILRQGSALFKHLHAKMQIILLQGQLLPLPMILILILILIMITIYLILILNISIISIIIIIIIIILSSSLELLL